MQLNLLRAQGIRNVTADMDVTGMELVGFEQNEWFDTLHVAIRARARDADVPVDWSEAKAHAAAGHAEAQPFLEVWSLVRSLPSWWRRMVCSRQRACSPCLPQLWRAL